jgi:hypothetical protein
VPPPPPTLPHSLGSSLVAQSEAVASALAAGDSCRATTLGHQLQQRTIAAINEGRVPGALQEPLSSAVNALVARVQCVPPPPRPQPRHDHGKQKDNGKHKGHGKKKDDEDG